MRNRAERCRNSGTPSQVSNSSRILEDYESFDIWFGLHEALARGICHTLNSGLVSDISIGYTRIADFARVLGGSGLVTAELIVLVVGPLVAFPLSLTVRPLQSSSSAILVGTAITKL